MPFYADRTQETTTTTGTGTITLGGAVTGYQAFSAAVPTGTRVCYCITDGTNWEVGDGVYTLSGTTLSRDNVYSSSNSNNLVSFAAGTKNVFITESGTKVSDLGMSTAVNLCWVPW